MILPRMMMTIMNNSQSSQIQQLVTTEVQSHLLAFSALDACLLADRPGLRRRLRSLRQRQERGQPIDQGLAQLRQSLAASRALVEQRRLRVPKIQYPEELPVSERRAEVGDLIARHQVVVLCGETGSGKSTQLPKICLRAHRPHPAATDRSAHSGQPGGAGAGGRDRRPGGLQGALP